MQKITTFLWFHDRAEEAMTFYVSAFRNSKILSVSRYGEGGPLPAGTVMTVTALLDGQVFIAMNGGPHYTLNPAISFVVDCETQRELDYYWRKLGDGGQELQCGWLTDRFGLSWQIVPRVLMELIHDPDPERKQRVLNAMYRMVKLDIAELQRAAGPEPNRATRAPKRAAKTPKRGAKTPKHTARSPRRAARSPKRTARTPKRGSEARTHWSAAPQGRSTKPARKPSKPRRSTARPGRSTSRAAKAKGPRPVHRRSAR